MAAGSWPLRLRCWGFLASLSELKKAEEREHAPAIFVTPAAASYTEGRRDIEGAKGRMDAEIFTVEGGKGVIVWDRWE